MLIHMPESALYEEFANGRAANGVNLIQGMALQATSKPYTASSTVVQSMASASSNRPISAASRQRSPLVRISLR